MEKMKLKFSQFLNSKAFFYILLALFCFFLACKCNEYDFDLYARLIVGEHIIEAKEFLYQATCLAIYLAAIVPIFKHGGFKLAKEKLFKNTNGFEHFKDVNHYLHYRKLAENSVANRQATLQKELADKTKVSELYDQTLLDELKKETPEKFADVKGAIEFSNLIGSVLGLAIIAPQLSHAFIHPALKFLGLENKDKKEINQAKQAVDKMIKEHHKLEEKQKNIDIKA